MNFFLFNFNLFFANKNVLGGAGKMDDLTANLLNLVKDAAVKLNVAMLQHNTLIQP